MPRRVGSSSSMISIARTFGAPVSVPAGKPATSASIASKPSAQPCPARRDMMCMTWLNRSMAKLSVTRTLPSLGDAADIVAAEVEQHQVFGALLRVGQQFAVPAAGLPRAWRRARRVPASGRMVTMSSRRRTRISGLLPTTAKPPKSRKNRNGAGLIRRSARYSANGGSANGTEKRWLGTTWNASPASDVFLRALHRGHELGLGEIRRRAPAAAAAPPAGRRAGAGGASAGLGVRRWRPARLPRPASAVTSGRGKHRGGEGQQVGDVVENREQRRAQQHASGRPSSSAFFAGSRSICRTMS